MGKSPTCDISEGLKTRGVSVPPCCGQAAGVGRQRQAAGVPFGGLWSHPGKKTLSTAVGLPETRLGSLWSLLAGISLHRLVGD